MISGDIKKKIELFRTSDRFEAVVGPRDEIGGHILVTGILLARIHAPAGEIWVEKVKQQLTASLTTTVKLPWGTGLTVISPHCFGGARSAANSRG